MLLSYSLIEDLVSEYLETEEIDSSGTRGNKSKYLHTLDRKAD